MNQIGFVGTRTEHEELARAFKEKDGAGEGEL